MRSFDVAGALQANLLGGQEIQKQGMLVEPERLAVIVRRVLIFRSPGKFHRSADGFFGIHVRAADDDGREMDDDDGEVDDGNDDNDGVGP